MNKLKVLLLACMLQALLCSNVMAATFNVNSIEDKVDAAPGNGVCASSTGQCTLRAAIQEANMLTGKDTIILPAGTYYIMLPGKYEDASATGDLDILQSVTIQGAGSDTTFVDGNNLDRVFHILDGIVEISGITIRKGKAVAQYGGGIYNYFGDITLTDCTVFGNQADGAGGGIYNYSGTLQITGSTISGNTAVYLPAYGYGDGGGIYNILGSVTITDSAVSGNIASVYGETGGIINGGTMVIENSTISDNTAYLFAGIQSWGNMTITNSTIYNNSSTSTDNCEDGAGVTNENIMTIQNSTIVENSPTNISNGDACYYFGGVFYIGNSIVKNTIPRVNCFLPDVPFHSSSKNNLSTDNTCGTHFSQKTASEINLGPLEDNGGPTDTMALLAGSVAIDGGDDASCPGTDQRGVLRPQGPLCDIGAFEYELTEPKSDQTITVDEHAPVSAAYGTNFTVSATATSGLGVAITTSGACSGSGTGSAVITMTDGTGTCTVFYNQAGDGTYNPAPQVNETTTAQRTDQTITVNEHAPVSAAYGTNFTVSATASSGLDVAITTSGACSGSGTGSATITMTSGTGTCTVLFDQAGSDIYNPAPQVTESSTAQRIGQTITISQNAPANADYNGTFNVSATSTSGLIVAITTSGACSGGSTGSALISMTCGSEPCVVHYNRAGNADYYDASEVTEETAVKYILSIAPSGTGIGTVIGNGLACNLNGNQSSGTCWVCSGTSYILQETPGACSFHNEDQVAQTANSITVTARFDLYPLVRLASNQDGYSTITEAYTNSIGETIHIQAHEFSEELTFNRTVDVAFDLGWNCDYTQRIGPATAGKITILYGSVTFQNGLFVIGP